MVRYSCLLQTGSFSPYSVVFNLALLHHFSLMIKRLAEGTGLFFSSLVSTTVQVWQGRSQNFSVGGDDEILASVFRGVLHLIWSYFRTV